jgi:hypothetical protein
MHLIPFKAAFQVSMNFSMKQFCPAYILFDYFQHQPPHITFHIFSSSSKRFRVFNAWELICSKICYQIVNGFKMRNQKKTLVLRSSNKNSNKNNVILEINKRRSLLRANTIFNMPEILHGSHYHKVP